MELKEAIEKRRSVRHFTKDPVPEEDLRELVRRAGMAPSVNNSQPWKFVVITNDEILREMASKVSAKIAEMPQGESRIAQNIKSQVEWFSTFFKEAPALIALTLEAYETILEKGVQISHEEINSLRHHPDIQTAGAAIQIILLSAVDMGYGACWMSGPLLAREEIEKILDIKPPFNLVTFVAVGKPQKDPVKKNKKDLDEIIRFIQ
jgi:nitroreductase